MASLQEYYANNYTECSKCERFICTWQGLAYTFHTFSAFSVPFYIFGGYCIVFKTPSQMSVYRKPLLNIHFWTCFVDIILNTLATPYLFLPALAGFSVGLLNFLRVPEIVQTWMGLQCVNIMMISITLILENRHNSIPFNRFQTSRKLSRLICYTIRILMGVTWALLIFILQPENQELAMLQVLKYIPCPTEQFFTFPATILLQISIPVVFLLPAFFYIGFSVVTGYYNQDYYQTNYTRCSKCERFMCSWQGVAYTFHSITVFSIPFYIFGGYCILFKSTSQMGSYRLPLFNFHFWTCLVDIMINALATPYFFFPSLAGFSVGFLNFLGVPPPIQTWLAFQSINLMTMSMTVLLENRHNSIPFNRFKISGKNTKSLYYAIRILLGLSYTLSMLLFIPEDQEAALLQILRQILCPTKEFFTASGVYVVCIDEGYIKFLALFTVLGTLSEICQMAFFVLCCSYYLFFSKSSFTSKKTRKLQIAFFASIILQISIPITFLLPTFFYLGFSVGFKYYNQVLHASLHGLISTFVVLIIHKPYRQFIILIFKSPSVVHKESVTTMRKMNGLTSRVTMNKLLNTLR